MLLFKFETWFDFFYSRNRAGTSTKQVRAHGHSPSFTKGISGQLKAIFNLENQWRLRSWINFKCIIIIIAFFVWNPSRWGSVLKYDYVLKLIIIVVELFVWLWWKRLWPKLVRCWVEIRWRLRTGYPKNRRNSAGFLARSLDA